MSGGKYAKKHQKELEKAVSSDKNSSLFEQIFDDSFNFASKFKSQDIDTQIEIVRILHNIVKKEENSPSSGKERFYAEEARYFLSSIHKMANCSFDEDIFYPLAKEEKRLIRMECYGTINRRKDGDLSFMYKYFRKQSTPNAFPRSAYKLLASPSWKVFHQFHSFRSIEPKIRDYLQHSGIHPDALQVMTINDFCEVIFQAHKKSCSDIQAVFLPAEEAIKCRQNRNLMKYCGDEVEQLLLKRKIDGRCVKSYCDMMRRFGCDDVNSLVVTERKYTARVLKDLSANGFNVDNVLLNSQIPQEFIDYLVDNKKANLILARNRNGKPVDKSRLPHLQDHHNRAVMLARHGDTIAAVNYPNNHISVDERLHHGYLHLFDRIVKSGNIEQISSRLNVQDTNMRLLLGFDAQKDAVFYDMEQTPEFQRRKAKDIKCKVNYFDMMEQRMQNEIRIAQKHNIKNSRAYNREAYHNLKEIKNSGEYNKELMTQVEKLLRSKMVSIRRGRHK